MKSPYGTSLVECKCQSFIHKEEIPMDHLYSTTSEHRNGQHLSFEHRLLIQTRLKSDWSYNKIAKEIDFISFVEKKFFEDGWSLDDSCSGSGSKRCHGCFKNRPFTVQ